MVSVKKISLFKYFYKWYKTKTFLECNGQNLFRTVEKSSKIKPFDQRRAPKKRSHILTIFPVLGKLTSAVDTLRLQGEKRRTGA